MNSILDGETAGWTDIDRLRQLRGLVVHVTEDLVADGHVRRGIPSFGFLKRYDRICRWCTRPTAKGTVWHRPCVCAYFAAVGNPQLREVVGPPVACPCGQPGQELDHIDALGLASASRDVHRYRGALSFSNLRWLCHRCHAVKTGDDRRRLRRLIAGPLPGDRVYGPAFANWTPAIQFALFGPEELARLEAAYDNAEIQHAGA